MTPPSSCADPVRPALHFTHTHTLCTTNPAASQAIDPAQFNVLTQYSMLKNTASGPVTNFRFRVDTWGGGFEPPGRLVQGSFK